jgi:hypothetical protein
LRLIDWQRLSDPERAALEETLREDALLFSPARSWASHFVRLICISIGAGLIATWIWEDYGEVFGTLTFQGIENPWVLLLGASCVSLIFFEWIYDAYNRYRLPWRPGFYVLPLHVVDAQSRWVAVYSTQDASEVRQGQHAGGIQIDFRFGETRIPVRLTGPDQKSRLHRFGTAQRLAAVAAAGGQADWLAERDTLRSMIEGATTKNSSVRGSPIRWGVEIGAAVLLCLPLASLRASLSDQVAFDKITAAPSVEAWEWYIEGDGRQRDVVESKLLPEARIAEDEEAFLAAQLENSTIAYQEYLRREHTYHDEEVLSDLLPEAELQAAIRSGKISILRGFIKNHEASQPERIARAGEAIAGRYSSELSRLLMQTQGNSQRLRKTFSSIVSWQEANGSNALYVVYNRPDVQQLATLHERITSRYRRECSTVEPVSSHLSASQAGSIEGAVFHALDRALDLVVSEEVVSLQRVTRAPEGPVVTIDYTISSDGSVYTFEEAPGVKGPKRCYIGLQFNFKVTISTPNYRYPYTFRLRARPPEMITVQYTSNSLFSEASTTSVYIEMSQRAFDNLATELRDRLFDPKTDAYAAMFDVLEDGR